MKTFVILMGCVVLGAGCGGSGGQGTVEERVVDRLILPAGAGGLGGSGGSVLVLYAESREDPEGEAFRRVFSLAGGAGGVSGTAELGPGASAGEAGPQGALESVHERDYSFDTGDIAPDMVTDIGAENRIYLDDNADPLPVMRLDTFRVRAGAEMEIGCDVRIRARSFIIEQGGRLTIRAREGMNCSIGIGRSLDRVAGLDGPLVYIEAGTVRLDGVLDIAGNPGTEGGDGGHGGVLTLRAEKIELGPEGRVLAGGGEGGAGLDERELGTGSGS